MGYCFSKEALRLYKDLIEFEDWRQASGTHANAWFLWHKKLKEENGWLYSQLSLWLKFHDMYNSFEFCPFDEKTFEEICNFPGKCIYKNVCHLKNKSFRIGLEQALRDVRL